MKPIVIFGAGQIAELAKFYFEDLGYHVAAFTVDDAYAKVSVFHGLPLLPFSMVDEIYNPSEYLMFVALSYTGVNRVRTQKVLEAKQRGYQLISYLGRNITAFNNEIGEHAFILEDNTLQPFAVIGKNVFMWSGNHIGHHSRIEDNCFISSHCVISGNVVVGEGTFIGVNSTIRDGITIGKQCIIGAGSLVLKDLPDFSVTTNPASEISKVPSTRMKF